MKGRWDEWMDDLLPTQMSWNFEGFRPSGTAGRVQMACLRDALVHLSCHCTLSWKLKN